jgi:hypothetical protein
MQLQLNIQQQAMLLFELEYSIDYHEKKQKEKTLCQQHTKEH